MKTRRQRVVALALALLALGEAAATEARRESDPERAAARRRWALAKMDEMANEARRCAERFRDRRQIEECRAAFSLRYREYNEMYLDAARE